MKSKQKSKENKSDLPYTEYLSIGSTSTSTSTAQPRKGEEKRVVVPGRLVECVVEDHPGVFVTVRRLPDGKQELRKVEIRLDYYPSFSFFRSCHHHLHHIIILLFFLTITIIVFLF